MALDLPPVFLLDRDGLATRDVNPGYEWVLEGQGFAVFKLDGEIVHLEGGKLYKNDGLEQVSDDDPTDQVYRDALTNSLGIEDGVYELLAPGIGSEPVLRPTLRLLRSSDNAVSDIPRDYDGLQQYLTNYPREGVVFIREFTREPSEDAEAAQVTSAHFGIEYPPKPMTVMTIEDIAEIASADTPPDLPLEQSLIEIPRGR